MQFFNMFSFDLKPTYNLSDSDILGLFWTALTSGSIGYGCVSLDCSSEAYTAAREAVLAANPERDYVVIEDVWTQVLKAGQLTYREYEEYDDHTGAAVPVTIDDLYHNLNEMQDKEPWILKQFAEGSDDADTHDAFLQYLLLGDIIYG